MREKIGGGGIRLCCAMLGWILFGCGMLYRVVLFLAFCVLLGCAVVCCVF